MDPLTLLIVFVAVVLLSVVPSVALVRDHEYGAIFRVGRLRGGKEGRGVVFLIPLLDRMEKVDLSPKTTSVDVQAITADGLRVDVEVAASYRIVDPGRALTQVSDPAHATGQVVVTALRNLISRSNRDEVELNVRHSIENLLHDLTALAGRWGVEVLNVEIKAVQTSATPDGVVPGAEASDRPTLSDAAYGAGPAGKMRARAPSGGLRTLARELFSGTLALLYLAALLVLGLSGAGCVAWSFLVPVDVPAPGPLLAGVVLLALAGVHLLFFPRLVNYLAGREVIDPVGLFRLMLAFAIAIPFGIFLYGAPVLGAFFVWFGIRDVSAGEAGSQAVLVVGVLMVVVPLLLWSRVSRLRRRVMRRLVGSDDLGLGDLDWPDWP